MKLQKTLKESKLPSKDMQEVQSLIDMSIKDNVK